MIQMIRIIISMLEGKDEGFSSLISRHVEMPVHDYLDVTKARRIRVYSSQVRLLDFFAKQVKQNLNFIYFTTITHGYELATK